MLRAGAGQLCKPLAVLFNKLFITGDYTQKWCKGLISTIFKCGDNTKPEYYRGITVSSNVARVYSMILNNTLTTFLEVTPNQNTTEA